jgi:hypothetical protein
MDIVGGNLFSLAFFPAGVNIMDYDVVSTCSFVHTNGPYAFLSYNSRTTMLFKKMDFAGVKNAHKANIHSFLDSMFSKYPNAADEIPFGYAIEARKREGKMTTYLPPTRMDCDEHQGWLWYNGSIFNVFRHPPQAFAKHEIDLRECVYMHYGGLGRASHRKTMFYGIFNNYFDRGYDSEADIGIAVFEKNTIFFRFNIEHVGEAAAGAVMEGDCKFQFSVLSGSDASGSTFEKSVEPLFKRFCEVSGHG